MKDQLHDLIDSTLQEPNLDFARILLRAYSKGELARIFRRLFKPYDPFAARLVRKPLKHVTDEDVLTRLDRIYELSETTLKSLLLTWADTYSEQLEALSNGRWDSSWNWPDPTWWEAAAAVLDRLGLTPHWSFLASIAAAAPVVQNPPDTERLSRELQNRLGKLQRKIERIEEEKEKLLKEYAEREKARVTQAEKALEVLQSEKDSWMKRAQQYQQELKHTRQEVNELEVTVRTLKEALKQRQKDLETLRGKYQECKKSVSALGRENENLKTKLVETRSALLQEQSLNGPLTPEELGDVWIIPYEGLGESSKERLVNLIDLYQAALENRAHPLLHQRTNWPMFSPREPKGLLLLDAERLLWDLSHLPVARLLRSAMFGEEALFYTLTHQYISPRLKDKR